jgi:methionine synthase I (cobalamin-dependent)
MQPDRSAELRALATRRILILDGAMGTMIQRHGLRRRTIAARASPTGRAT